jgi:hypothetical protein
VRSYSGKLFQLQEVQNALDSRCLAWISHFHKQRPCLGCQLRYSLPTVFKTASRFKQLYRVKLHSGILRLLFQDIDQSKVIGIAADAVDNGKREFSFR